MNNNYLSALNGSLERQSKLQEQLTDGQIVHRPSDDPVRTIRDMRFKTNLAINDQYTQNVADSQSWMDSTDSAMSDLSSIMIRVKELVVSADGTKPADALNAIGVEIDQLINQAISVGNQKIGDRYLFSGQMDKTQPFERKTITDPNNPNAAPMDVVVYNGDLNKISMQIKEGVINPTQDSINLTGAEVFGPLKTIYGQPTMSIFSQLIAIKQELQGNVRQTPTVPGIVGTTSISGTYTGTGHTYFDVRIDSTTGGTTSLDTTKPLSSQFAGVTGIFNLVVNGHTVAVDSATDTMTTLLSNIKAAGAPGITDAKFDPATGKISLVGTSDFTGSDAPAGTDFLTNNLKLPTGSTTNAISSGDIATVNITSAATLASQFPSLPAGALNLKLTNGALTTTIAFDPAVQSLDDLMNSINGAGVHADASYNAATGKFTLKATSGTLDFSGSDPVALQVLTDHLRMPDPAAGQVQTASYSTDGGNTWSSANVTPGDPSTVLLTNGMSLSIGQNTGNKVGGISNFHAPGGIDKDWISQVGLANVDAAHKSMLREHTQLGTRMATYAMAQNMLEDNSTNIIDTISKNIDIDFPSAVINQKANENVYKAALAVGSKLMQLSLVDFLR